VSKFEHTKKNNNRVHVKIKSPAAAAPAAGYKPENPLDALTAFKDWQACWLRAIALAWSDPTKKAALLTNASQFFTDYCNYKVPETMTITVVDDAAARWTYDGQHTYSWDIHATDVTFHLPPPPPTQTDWPIALADYESVGLSYPFTFCC
jgi:ribosomally synthesized peptide (two-chain TOMM family)